jgi:hypothetical protein
VQTGASAGYVISELIKDLSKCRNIDKNTILPSITVNESSRKKTFREKFSNDSGGQVFVKAENISVRITI